jgi:hypothetical protein
MSSGRARLRVADVPPPRPEVKLPPRRTVGIVPGGQPKGHTPTVHVAQAPPERAAAKPPKPRKPKRVRDSGDLGDLFAIFPDLPRPFRPRPEPIRAHAGLPRGRRWR